MTNHMHDVTDVTDVDVDGSAMGDRNPLTHEMVRSAPTRVKASLDPPHVATVFFAERFQELASQHHVHMLDNDRMRKLTPLRIQRMLKEQAPDLPVSQTQIYRYVHGDAPPRLDVVYELARLFGVAPTYFVEGSDEPMPSVPAPSVTASSVPPAKGTLDPPHVATQFFAERLQALAGSMNVRMLDTDRVRKLTPLRIQQLLKEQAPDLPVSQTQIYRYVHGHAPPRLDVVSELARLFSVPPAYFVPDRFLPE